MNVMYQMHWLDTTLTKGLRAGFGWRFVTSAFSPKATNVRLKMDIGYDP